MKRKAIELLSPNSIVLDVGCGHKAKFLRSMSPYVKKAYGIDLNVTEKIVDGNLTIIKGNAENIPMPDHSVDVVTMINVSEHLRDPESVFLECKRILKPGGSLFSIAPCKFYPPLFIARLLPHRVRRRVNHFVNGTEMEDTFPAYYRANSRRTLCRLSSSVGLNVVSIKYLLYHPEYAMFSVVLYRCAVAVERAILTKESFRFFRHQIFCHLKSPVQV